MQNIDISTLTQLSLLQLTVVIKSAYRSQLIFRNINKLQGTQKGPVITSAELCSAFGRREKSKQRRLRDCEGGNIPPSSLLLSCMKMARSLVSPWSLSLSTLPLAGFAFRAHALVHRHSCSPPAKKPSTKVHQDKSADLLSEEKVKQAHICTMSKCQSKHLLSKTDIPMTVHPLCWFKALQWDWVGFQSCCHGNYCFALFLPVLHSSTQCDEK